MQDVVDLNRYPLDQRGPALDRLIGACRRRLAADGMFTLDGFMTPGAVAAAVAAVRPKFESESFLHRRRHNIYFSETVGELPSDHPALSLMETTNRTLCADQVADTALRRLYDWPAFAAFLAAAMDKRRCIP